MEEKYWKQFMTTGKIDDYLGYKGVSICAQIMKKYEDISFENCKSLAESKGQYSESDNSYGNGLILRSYR